MKDFNDWRRIIFTMENKFYNVKQSESSVVHRKQIQSVDRALTLLEEIACSEDPLSLKELSSRLGLNTTTTFHLLGTLMAHGFVVQDPYTKAYKLGIKILEFMRPVLNGIEVRSLVRPFLVELMEQTEETASLVVFEDDEAIYVDQVQSKRASIYRVFTGIGGRLPLHCTGMGKVYLAYHSDDEVREIVTRAGLEQFTKKTITAIDQLLSELERIRQINYAVNDEEHEDGMRCIGVPLLNQNGKIIAAISISGSTSRITVERIPELAAMLLEASRRISTQLELILEAR